MSLYFRSDFAKSSKPDPASDTFITPTSPQPRVGNCSEGCESYLRDRAAPHLSLRFIFPLSPRTTPISYLISLFQPSPGYYFEGTGQLPLKVTDTSHRVPVLSYWGTLPSIRWGKRNPKRVRRERTQTVSPIPTPSQVSVSFSMESVGGGGGEVP